MPRQARDERKENRFLFNNKSVVVFQVGDLATIDVQQKQLEQNLKAASNKIDLYQQQMDEKEAELRQLRAATQADDDDGGGGLAGGSSEVRENAFPAPLVYQN